MVASRAAPLSKAAPLSEKDLGDDQVGHLLVPALRDAVEGQPEILRLAGPQVACFSAGDGFPLGATTVTYTATDAAGHVTSRSFTLTVVDDTKPVITPGANVTVPTDGGQCAALVASLDAGIASAQPPKNDYSQDASWLCRPGRQDACAVDLTTTIVAANGSLTRETWTANPSASIDCL